MSFGFHSFLVIVGTITFFLFDICDTWSVYYSMLQELVDLDGYYLEREPCMTCNDPEISYSNLKLNNIKVWTLGLDIKYCNTISNLRQIFY